MAEPTEGDFDLASLNDDPRFIAVLADVISAAEAGRD